MKRNLAKTRVETLNRHFTACPPCNIQRISQSATATAAAAKPANAFPAVRLALPTVKGFQQH